MERKYDIFYCTFLSHSQKSAAFRFNKSAKNVKKMSPKTEDNHFGLLDSSPFILKTISFDLAKHSKFDLNSDLWK